MKILLFIFMNCFLKENDELFKIFNWFISNKLKKIFMLCYKVKFDMEVFFWLIIYLNVLV